MTQQDKILDDLEEKIGNRSASSEDCSSALRWLRQRERRLRELLEWAAAVIAGDEGKRIERIHKEVAQLNAADLMDTLSGYGFKLLYTDEVVPQKERREDLQKAIVERQGFRLMELTRLGKRDEVHYQLLRLFASYGIDFPRFLLEPFKPSYTDEIFKALILSFLAGTLSGSRTQNQQHQN
jgi:hypothetical protein